MKETDSLPVELRPAYERLMNVLERYGSLVVAYSGGVDSALLAFMARRSLGDRMVAAIGVSPSLSKREKELALSFLETHSIPYLPVITNEMDDERYRMNDAERCYYCKSELFVRMREVAEKKGFAYVAYGANADDEADHRPGARAAEEQHVVAPFIEAGVDKSLIRRLAKACDLDLWDKPASPCLASRIPYFSSIDGKKLQMVEEAEGVLRDLGFPVCRVRHHGEMARIELPCDDHIRLLSDTMRKAAVDGIKKAGFMFVSLDLEPFKSGRLNEFLEQSKEN